MEKKQQQQITRCDGLIMGGIFVIPIRDGHFGTPAGDYLYISSLLYLYIYLHL